MYSGSGAGIFAQQDGRGLSAGAVTLTVLVGFLALVAVLALLAGAIVLVVKLVRRVSAHKPGVADSSAPLRALVGCGIPSPAGADRFSDATSLATWRYGQLLELDVDPVTAMGAALAGVEPESVRAFVECGWSPLLALSILEPDEPA